MKRFLGKALVFIGLFSAQSLWAGDLRCLTLFDSSLSQFDLTALEKVQRIIQVTEMQVRDADLRRDLGHSDSLARQEIGFFRTWMSQLTVAEAQDLIRVLNQYGFALTEAGYVSIAREYYYIRQNLAPSYRKNFGFFQFDLGGKDMVRDITKVLVTAVQFRMYTSDLVKDLIWLNSGGFPNIFPGKSFDEILTLDRAINLIKAAKHQGVDLGTMVNRFKSEHSEFLRRGYRNTMTYTYEQHLEFIDYLFGLIGKMANGEFRPNPLL